MLTTDQKGAIAEMGIAWHATQLGVDVYKPVAEGRRCDLIFDFDGRLWRVQCKWAPLEGGVLTVRCYSCRRAREGMRKRRYTPDEIDAFAAYCAELDRCYFLPIDRFPRRAQIRLRLAKTRNNQREFVNWAEDFEFAATLASPQGAVAQLGERMPGRHEVTGSSPVGSTLFPVDEHPSRH
jgi:PD-(D/E)XK nuclease superfamily protein